MARETLILIVAALVLSCGCVGGSGTVTDIGANNSSQGVQENISVANQTNAIANSTPEANATQDITPQNATGNVSLPGQCTPISAPSQAEYGNCASLSKAMIEVKDVWNCTTAYKCMNASERVAYDISKMQGPGCQDIPDVLINGLADECGANYQRLNATMENGCLSAVECMSRDITVIESNGSGS
jgi:hypothetical protein